MRIIAILGLLPFMYKLQVNFCTVVAADTKLVLALVTVENYGMAGIPVPPTIQVSDF